MYFPIFIPGIKLEHNTCFLLNVTTSFPLSVLRGYCTVSYQKLACFVLYLKIINMFLKNNICYALYKTLFEELKNGIEILVGQAVFKL